MRLGRREGKPVVALSTAGGEPPAISIDGDASSIIFLHAAAQSARNVNADDYTWNYADTADLLGWYEVTYEDGFVENCAPEVRGEHPGSGVGKEPQARRPHL